MSWIIGGLIFFGIIGALSGSSGSSDSGSSNSFSDDYPSRKCNHEWSEWYKTSGNDKYMGSPIYRKRKCKKCGEVDF